MNIQFGSTKLNYIDEGNGNATLLLMHGWCINKDYWRAQVDFLKNDYRCIAIDLPGFGQSTADRSNWTIEAYSRDLIEVIERLDLQNVILIAHSLAGSIALELMQKPHPGVRGIIGIDNFKTVGVTYTPEEYRQFDGMMKMLASDFRNAAPAFAENMLLHTTTPEAVSNRVKRDFAKADPGIGFSSLSNLLEYSMLEPAKLENLTCKLHLLNCNNSSTNIASLEKHCAQGVSLSEIAATSHYPMIEAPHRFNEALAKIIGEIEVA